MHYSGVCLRGLHFLSRIHGDPLTSVLVVHFGSVRLRSFWSFVTRLGRFHHGLRSGVRGCIHASGAFHRCIDGRHVRSWCTVPWARLGAAQSRVGSRSTRKARPMHTAAQRGLLLLISCPSLLSWSTCAV